MYRISRIIAGGDYYFFLKNNRSESELGKYFEWIIIIFYYSKNQLSLLLYK